MAVSETVIPPLSEQVKELDDAFIAQRIASMLDQVKWHQDFADGLRRNLAVYRAEVEHRRQSKCEMTEEVAELAANLNAALQAGLEDESFGCILCGEAPCVCLDEIEE